MGLTLFENIFKYSKILKFPVLKKVLHAIKTLKWFVVFLY